MHYTIDQLKADLPNVPVLMGKKRIQCRLAGRDNLFATVLLPNALSVQVAWSTVQHVLATDRAVRL